VSGAFAEDGWRFVAAEEGSGEIFSGAGFICGSWTVLDAVRWYKRSVLAHPIIPETTKESTDMTFIAGMTGTRNWQTIQKRRWWRKRLRAKFFARSPWKIAVANEFIGFVVDGATLKALRVCARAELDSRRKRRTKFS
jgi:hypothetical protein